MTLTGHSEKVLIVRIFLLFLVLIFNFQFLAKAENVGDFLIEGMSIGESALKHFDEQYIKNGITHENTFKYKDNKFVSIGTVKNYEIYDNVGIIIKPEDKNYKIYSLEGTLNYGDKINKCYEQQKIIEKDIDDLLGNKVFKDTWEDSYKYDDSGKSKVKYIDYNFDDGSAIRIVCYDMDDDFIDPNDQLVVIVNTKEFMEFLGTL